jgi:hypothetical protein
VYISYFKYKENCIVVTPVCVEGKEVVLLYGHISPYMVNKCVLHMFNLKKKSMDIVISKVVVQLFLMPLFCIMSTPKYRKNITTEHVGTEQAPDFDFARHGKQQNRRSTHG